MDDYTKMWKELELDLPAHDHLLKVLGKFYNDIYLTQNNRLKGMEYLDLVISEIHGLRIKELMEAKKRGRKIFGTFCIFVPEELIWASDGICVGLCSGADTARDEAEKVLPRTICPLIKSFFGFMLARLCPFIESCDLVIGETTCDGKKKAFEIFKEYKPIHVMEVPQMKRTIDSALWKEEVLRLKDTIEGLTKMKITPERLKSAIRMINARRKVLQWLNKLRKAIPVPISGRDALLVNQISFYDDPKRFREKITQLCKEIEERIKKKEGVVPEETIRILLSGCPMAVPNWKLPYIIESSGAVVVSEESCVGERNFRYLVEEDGDSIEEMIDNMVERYMKIDCACFTPNEERIKHIIKDAKSFNVDGVIHYSLQFCDPYSVESYKVEKALEKEDIPCLRIETDYSMEDVEQLKNRIEAFLEMLK